MSTQQQAMILDTILAIKRTLKRKAHDSDDSDDSTEYTTNRGNKLKKTARFVKKGRLASSNGPSAYKEVAEHAGFHRTIISRNPPLIDEEGYEIDSDDDEERVQEAVASAMEENPYASIHIEQILGPLTAVTDLPTHPTFSRPFTSKALNELVSQARLLMQKENAALWKAKPLLTRLIGDNTWVPCGMMIEPTDIELFTDAERFLGRSTIPPPLAIASGENGSEGSSRGTGKRKDSPLRQPNSVDSMEKDAGTDKGNQSGGEASSEAHNMANGQAGSAIPNGEEKAGGDPQVERTEADGDAAPDDPVSKANGGPPEDVEMDDAPGAEPAPPPGALVSNGRGASVDEYFIHPLFLAPRSAHPDRDLGLPEAEADDVRRLLQLYVQKQEEVCRGTKKLYEGLLKADRYRRTVWQWAKAEAHSGPNHDMSDGEDWYDKEEWGLTEDLKKGEDEVEEDSVQTQKKTRNRRN
ncbi:hypothetical protein QBC39DRAFT_326141 [Podospora conica]|nr:hypothetical protein QBC39DRAFT_326141 [Schizothecium conicum]